jgi:hypothetical protein
MSGSLIIGWASGEEGVKKGCILNILRSRSSSSNRRGGDGMEDGDQHPGRACHHGHNSQHPQKQKQQQQQTRWWTAWRTAISILGVRAITGTILNVLRSRSSSSNRRGGDGMEDGDQHPGRACHHGHNSQHPQKQQQQQSRWLIFHLSLFLFI